MGDKLPPSPRKLGATFLAEGGKSWCIQGGLLYGTVTL